MNLTKTMTPTGFSQSTCKRNTPLPDKDNENLYYSVFLNINPSYSMIQSEQTKIADFLSALDRETASVATPMAATNPDGLFGDSRSTAKETSSTISAPSSTISDASSTISRSGKDQNRDEIGRLIAKKFHLPFVDSTESLTLNHEKQAYTKA